METTLDTKNHTPTKIGLEAHGLQDAGALHWNLSTAALVEMAMARQEARLSNRGSVVVHTGNRTGRSPKDKFIVSSQPSRELIDWGKINVPIAQESFDLLLKDMSQYLNGKEIFIQDCWAGADPAYRMGVRVVNELAWQNLFAKTLFISDDQSTTVHAEPEFMVVALPLFQADPKRHGTNSEAFVVIDFERNMVLIGGTRYAGEMKKSIFTVLNHVLPQKSILPMHCSANVGTSGDTALFFGLSGTGKTTLSADPQRGLIGDDEHGWGPTGIFNFEGGCYAKCINLSSDNEPQIYNALRFGTVLENVVIDDHSGVPDFDDDRLTENTRAAYPLSYIDNMVHPSMGGHPKHVVFLTCDAFGVLPPIAKLTEAQAMYHFLSGYTAKVAGTEAGITEPQATFSTLFGAPFFTQKPMTYANMLGERLKQHQAQCWLVNTGWTGGAYGIGERMKLPVTRRLLNAALSGELPSVSFTEDPVFGLNVPIDCPDVPKNVLVPKNTWPDSSAYDRKASELSGLFKSNFAQFQGVTPDVLAAGPK